MRRPEGISEDREGWRRWLAEEQAYVRSIIGAADRRLWYLVATIVFLASLSTLVFTRFAGLSLVDAIYFTTAIVTTIGFGDINLREAPTPLKLYGVVFMLLGAALLAVSYAFITDLLVRARLARQSGVVPRRLRDHIAVCGLGTIGYRIVEQLAQMRVPVVAVELRDDGPFVQPARSLGVPILFANARQPEALAAARLGQARCLVIATDDDVANLETTLNASALNPGLRIVPRLFHPDFAAQVERTFDIHISRSPSALAAPAFAAAAEGERVLGAVQLDIEALIFARTRVDPGTASVGETVAELEESTEARVHLLADDDHERWLPSKDSMLAAGQELVVVASRKGLTQVLERTEEGVVQGGQGM